MTFSGTLFCIHGFIGLSTDWNAVIPADVDAVRVDLFSPQPAKRPPQFDFASLTQWVNERARAMPQPRVLVGYSLGGRIALHALLGQPDLWAGAVFVSTHPGLKDLTEKAERLAGDKIAAEQFTHQPWDELMTDWNRKGVFSGGKRNPERAEKDYSRESLARALRESSVGLQEDLGSRLGEIPFPILWVVGEKDPKYLALGQELAARHPQIQLRVVPDSAHRVLIDQPDVLRNDLFTYLDGLRARPFIPE